MGAAALSGEEKAARNNLTKEKGDSGAGKLRKRGTWKVPAKVEGASICVPMGDVRVRIRRREGLPKGRMVGR